MNDHFLFWYEIVAIWLMLGSVTHIAYSTIFLSILHHATKYKPVQLVSITLLQLLISIILAFAVWIYAEDLLDNVKLLFPISIPALITECITILPIFAYYIHNKKRRQIFTIKERILVISIICSTIIIILLNYTYLIWNAAIVIISIVIIMIESILLVSAPVYEKAPTKKDNLQI